MRNKEKVIESRINIKTLIEQASISRKTSKAKKSSKNFYEQYLKEAKKYIA
jgi:hypothetical protein